MDLLFVYYMKSTHEHAPDKCLANIIKVLHNGEAIILGMTFTYKINKKGTKTEP